MKLQRYIQILRNVRSISKTDHLLINKQGKESDTGKPRLQGHPRSASWLEERTEP